MTQSTVPGEGTRRGNRRARELHQETARRAAKRSGHRGSDGEEPGRRGQRKRRRKGKHRIFRWIAISMAVLILGTATAGYLYYRHLNGNIQSGKRSSGDSKVRKSAANADGQRPLNILLLGSDSRNSAENVKLGGHKESVGTKPRADVQMLVHLSADRKSAAVVSIPRDTRVDIPACTDPATGEKFPATNEIITDTLTRGGAGCTLATWQNLTGVYIDHWMMIDFAGVVSMADAIGGVDVCVKQNVWDHPTAMVRGGSGLKLKAGTTKVKGKQALQWLRTRHAFYNDQGRAKAQHMYLNSMLRSLKEQNVFTDSGHLLNLAEAATKSLKVSEEIDSVKKLYDLAMQLKTVPTDRITMLTVPTIKDNKDDQHLLMAEAKADKIFSMLREDVPFDKNGKAAAATAAPSPSSASQDPAAPDGQIAVQVQNGTQTDAQAATPHRAGAVAQLLLDKGFTQTEVDRSPPLSEKTTVVRYPSADLKGDAQRVAEALGIPATSAQPSSAVSGVTVVVGADWRSGTTYPKQPAPKAGDIPDGSDASNASDEVGINGQCMDVYWPYRW
ncbi:LCP family protein [Streptomyces sp. MS06]|uniref:LCP family protein n=1 Tax=Streptomyces sp. MS06 TaxID=3385974 RepID=UPI0039A027F9